jgi:hypothetical protein
MWKLLLHLGFSFPCFFFYSRASPQYSHLRNSLTYLYQRIDVETFPSSWILFPMFLLLFESSPQYSHQRNSITYLYRRIDAETSPSSQILFLMFLLLFESFSTILSPKELSYSSTLSHLDPRS